MNRVLIAVVLSAAGALAQGCGGDAPSPSPETVTVTVTQSPSTPGASTEVPPEATTTDAPITHTISGTLQLTVDRNPAFPENCKGFEEEGYGDIREGQRVVVLDGSGNTIGLGELADCEFKPLESPEQARGIRFTFTVPDVPEVPFIKLSVGGDQRGEVTYSLDQLAKADWKVELSL